MDTVIELFRIFLIVTVMSGGQQVGDPEDYNIIFPFTGRELCEQVRTQHKRVQDLTEQVREAVRQQVQQEHPGADIQIRTECRLVGTFGGQQ